MCFWTYALRNTWLDKRLKSAVSKDPSTSDMVNGRKDCWNLNDSNFIILIDPCEGNPVWKSLPYWYGKSYDCYLTHWLLMTSMLFLTEEIYCNIFRSNYLTNEKYFLNFLLHFRNLDSILNIFKIKDDPHDWCIFELTHSEIRG